MIRLCGKGSFGSGCPPFVDFPPDLRECLQSKLYFCEGGNQIDGSEISPVEAEEIACVAEDLTSHGITDIVVAGIFSPVDSAHEERVAEILHAKMTEIFAQDAQSRKKVRITCSHTISSLGFLARENASILNASLRPMAERTIRGFQQAIKVLFNDPRCALYLTQNDGSILSANEAVKLPIRTFNSGPTNSIRGGAFLWKAAGTLIDAQCNGSVIDIESSQETPEALVVVDVGGTTTDAGLLLPNGFPRMSSVTSDIAGVRTKFGLPAVHSIGLVGGSIIRRFDDGNVRVGPDSVGFRLPEKARIFGGDVLTATDIAVASAQQRSAWKGNALQIGDPSLITGLTSEVVQGAKSRIKELIEDLIDGTKIHRGDIDVLIVGGGAIIVDTQESLKGVRNCRTVVGGEVANAVGAAISKVGGIADMVMDITNSSISKATEEVKRIAIENAAREGASKATIEVAEVRVLPVQYVQAKARILVKAIGELDEAAAASEGISNGNIEDDTEANEGADEGAITSEPSTKAESRHFTVTSPNSVPSHLYKPCIQNHEWIISTTDLDFMSIGCKILGCGGGGDPYVEYLKTKTLLTTKPGTVRVIDASRLKDSAIVGWCGNMGSPEVSQERMEGNEPFLAQKALMKYMNLPNVDAMIALEIGGANGLVNLGVAADLGIPVVDADYMGRAYPTYWQTTANVYGSSKGENLVPAAIASGDGSFMIMSASKTDKLCDRALRAACVEMGSRAGKAAKPQSGYAVRTQSILNTISLAWRIGRAVRMEKNIADIADRIIEQVGGPQSSRKIFEGKVVGVERTLKTGHTYGVLEIEGMETTRGAAVKTTCRIPFKNENALAELGPVDGKWKTLVTVPDLIAVLDAETGQGLTVPEYRYGLKVIVIAIAASPHWTGSSRGLDLGGPGSMGFSDVEYCSVGTYSKPRSVIEEFGPKV